MRRVAGLTAVLLLASAPALAQGTDGTPPALSGYDAGRPDAAAPIQMGAPVLDMTLSPGSEGRGIPWDAFDRAAYLRVRDVVADAAAAREVRDIVFRSRPEVLDFLLDHPDFASEVGMALRRGKYRLRRNGDAYEAADGEGASGRMWQVLNEGGRRVFYIEGRYDGLMLPTFSGRMVVLLDTPHLEGLDGMTYCEARFAGFVKFDSGLADILARSARLLSESRVDRAVRRLFRHIAVVSRRAYDDPEGLADELDGNPALSREMMTRFRQVLTVHLPPRWAKPEEFRLVEPGPLDPGADDGHAVPGAPGLDGSP
jgi:hypothetical protein